MKKRGRGRPPRNTKTGHHWLNTCVSIVTTLVSMVTDGCAAPMLATVHTGGLAVGHTVGVTRMWVGEVVVLFVVPGGLIHVGGYWV